MPPAAMASTCPTAVGTSMATIIAATATVARSRSGVRLVAIAITACATTATAAAFNPSIQPPASGSIAAAPQAKATSRIAEGRVKATQAASMPA